jgi:hypothetical protein
MNKREVNEQSCHNLGWIVWARVEISNEALELALEGQPQG